MPLVYISILAVFAWLMISRRLTATLALPLAALCLAIVALARDVPSTGALAALSVLISDVIEPGINRLSGAIFAVILGAVLASQMQITGAAERIVRYATEYAGEDRFRLGLLLLVVIATLFTTLGGLGAVILVASLTLPLMFSLGFEPKAAGGLFLLGLSLGGCLNPVNWALYKSVLELPESSIIPFAIILALLFFLVTCVFLLFYASGHIAWQKHLLLLIALVGACALFGVLMIFLPSIWLVIKHILATCILLVLIFLAVGLVVRTTRLVLSSKLSQCNWRFVPGNWLASASLLVPLLLLLWSALHANLMGDAARLNVPILVALFSGIAFCALASLTRDGAATNRLMRALFEGVTYAGPAIVLLLGIGLLLKAVTLPGVVTSLKPWFAQLPVSSAPNFVATFFILSPLALYRGPLNLYGMGSGVVGIIADSAILAGNLTMVAFFSVGMLQGVCDPTNTHNVWIANFCKVPVGELTRLTIPWVMVITLLGLIAGSVMFFSSFATPLPWG